MPTNLRLTFQTYGAVPPFTIEVFTASFDALQLLSITSTTVGAGNGKVTFDPFSFTKKPDAHSAEFWSRVCTGTPYQTVTLNASMPESGAPFFTFTMGIVACKTMAFSAAETNGAPLETITLEYGQGVYSVASQNPDGTFGKGVSAGWDRIKNVVLDPGKVGAL